MSVPERSILQVTTGLRSSFDAGFARPHPPEPPPQVDLLQIRVAGHGYALRLSQVLALQADRKLVAVPSARFELLGLIGVRGVVAPVYDLSRLLGYAAAPTARWLAQVRAPAPFALAFEVFAQHLRVPQSDLTAASVDAARAFAPESVQREDGLLPVIDLLAIFREVISKSRQKSAHEREERR
jgi:chemotaxis signal transduction protein